ncbi:MAG TPA: cytochrome P450 [Jiangellales bacterium]|nr:cytochrome P450 [Jiangellales bacterium]
MTATRPAQPLAAVPGPQPADMLREARRMIRDPLGYLGDVVTRYGPVVSFPMPRTPVLLVNSPAAARRVLVDNHRAYGKRTIQYDTLALVTGQGLLVSDPPEWMSHRRMVQPAFHRDSLGGVGRHTVDAARRALATWDGLPAGSVVDVDAAMMRASLEVVGSALFSTDLSGDATRIVDAVLAALDRVVVRARSPWLPPPSVPTPGNLRLRRALRTIDEAVAAMVAARSAADPGDDVLGMLLRARDEAGLDDTAVRDEVVTLLVAGHETVASSLTWTLDLLARHPDAQERLAAEVTALPADPDAADLPRLPWTRAVVDEALRLYPPAWVVTRRALQDDEVCGYTVPAGSVVLVSPYTVHRDRAVWPDPERFDPHRFLGGAPARGTYLPFGAGPRLCIGREFALVESVLVLGTLARRYTVEPVPGPPARVDALVTLRPHGGLPLRLNRRV